MLNAHTDVFRREELWIGEAWVLEGVGGWGDADHRRRFQSCVSFCAHQPTPRGTSDAERAFSRQENAKHAISNGIYNTGQLCDAEQIQSTI